VIIRWTDNNIEDEMRVVTHVIDLNAMSNLSRMLDQGVKNFQEASGKKEGKPEEKTGENAVPGPGGGAPPPPITPPPPGGGH
jgi:hypothetical protein